MNRSRNPPLTVEQAFVAIHRDQRKPLLWNRAAASALLNLAAVAFALGLGVVLGSRRA